MKNHSVKIGDRTLRVTRAMKLEIEDRKKLLVVRDRQLTTQINMNRIGPRKTAGSQFAPWQGTNHSPKHLKDTELVYSV